MIIDKNRHVYCTNCTHFKTGRISLTPHCKYEDRYEIDNFENNMEFKYRPNYKSGINNKTIKICYIERCYQCRYCGFDSEWSYEEEGTCWYNREETRKIKDVNKEPPEWCPLDDA